MPKKPIEWSKCIIYKIWKDDDFYIGSTTDLASRKSSHKSISNNEKSERYNLKIYQTIREKGGWDSWQMIPLEEYTECQSKIQAIIREEEWRVKVNANLNSKRAYISKDIFKEEGLLRDKKYREKHKEQISEKKKKKITCECGAIIRKQHKARHERSQKHQTYLISI